MSKRSSLKFVLICATIGAFAGRASAQTLRGTIRDASTTTPIRGVFVELALINTSTRVQALTDESGRFALKTPAAGAYTFSAQMIGYSTRERVVTLAADEVVDVDVSLAVSAISLPEIAVTKARRCGERSHDPAVVRLWEEARKALRIAAWSAEDTVAQYRIRSLDRYIARDGKQISPATMTLHRVTGRNAFQAAEADDLATMGYVRRVNGQWSFFGPDATLLLSPEFQEQHCFWVERRNDRPGLIGLAFEPLPTRRISDIQGELWIDTQTGELRYVDYGFVNLEYPVRREHAGGRTEYVRLSHGAWIVSRWEIRMPFGRVISRTSGGDNETIRNEFSVQTIQIFSREVLEVQARGTESLILIPSFALRGIVYDSLRAQPFAKARVRLANTEIEALTDSVGEFVFDSIPRGEYEIIVDHPRLDSIPAPHLTKRIVVDSLFSFVHLATPHRTTLKASLCARDRMRGLPNAPEAKHDDIGALRMVVRLDSVFLRGVTVNVEWSDVTGAGPAQRILAETTNEKGEAVICGVPVGWPLSVTISNRTRTTRFAIQLPPEGVLQVPVDLTRAATRVPVP